MNCPKCQSPMTPVKVGIVEVDRCTSCGGLWFDSLEEEWLKTPADAAALDVGDTASACDSLRAFLNQVRAQNGKELTSAQAEGLTDAANDIRALLGC